MEPVGPSGQLRRTEGPARGDDPVPDDPGRPARRSTRRASTSSRSAGCRTPTVRSTSAATGSSIVVRDLSPERAAAGRGPARRPSPRTACPTTSTISGSARWVLGPVHRPRLAEGRSRDGPLAGDSPSPTPSIARATRRRRPSSGSAGAGGPRPRPRLERSSDAEHRDLPGRSSRRTTAAPSHGSSESSARSTSRRSRATSGTSCCRGWIERNTRPDQRVMVDLKVGDRWRFPCTSNPEQRAALERLALAAALGPERRGRRACWAR